MTKIIETITLSNSAKKVESIIWSESTETVRFTVSYGMTYYSGNSQPYFSITADEEYMTQYGWRTRACGCMHEEIAEKFPMLAPLIPYHLSGQDGLPMHYIANAKYWFEEGKWETLLEQIRWEPEIEADPRDMDFDTFSAWLERRIPLLKDDFDSTMRRYGVEYIDT